MTRTTVEVQTEVLALELGQVKGLPKNHRERLVET